MSIGGIFLGLINIGIVVILLLIVGLIAKLILEMIGISIPDQIRKLYLALVGLIALWMLVALLFSLPTISILPMRRVMAALTWIA